MHLKILIKHCRNTDTLLYMNAVSLSPPPSLSLSHSKSLVFYVNWLSDTCTCSRYGNLIKMQIRFSTFSTYCRNWRFLHHIGILACDKSV